MGIVERCIRQPVGVAVVVLLITIFGIISLFRIPIQLTPNVDQPVILVTTQWFGADPQEIEREIVQEQEDKLKTVSGLRLMTSTSSEGQAQIRLEFSVGVNKDAALNEVRDKLRRVPDYPPEVEEPVVESVDSGIQDYIAWMLVRPIPGKQLSFQPGEVFRGDVTELQTFLEDNVKPTLERAEGVAAIQVLGGREREMQVKVDLKRLASRGITIDEFVQRLRDENANVSAGAVSSGKRDVTVRAVGRYDSPEDIRNTVISYDVSGAPIYVNDVADVEVGFKRQVAFVRSLGEPVMALNAKRETGTNVLQVMGNLKQQIDRVNNEILGPRGWGLELFQVYDQTVYVERSLMGARDDVILGAILAAVVLFLTLRSFGATIIVALSIPISVVGTFLGIALTGRNLNVISIAGLSFAIGMGVDNTIVVLENIFRHREMGKDRMRAAIDGTSEVWGAIVAATLANIAVFLPVVFIEEEAGQLFRDISIAISISLFFYMVVSPTVIPVLATLFLRRMPAGFVEGGTEQKRDTMLGAFTRPFARVASGFARTFYVFVYWLTHGVIRRVVLVVAMIGIASYLSYALMPPRTYLPTGNQNLVLGIILTPPGYSLSEFSAIGSHVERNLKPWWEAKKGSPEEKALQEQWKQMVANVPMLAGTGVPPSAIDQFFFVAFNGIAFMGATSANADSVAPTVQLLQSAGFGIPGTFPIAFQNSLFNLGEFGGGAITVDVSGGDYETVRNIATAVQMQMMGALQAFVRPEPQNFNLGRPETRVLPDRERAALAGVPTSTIRRLTAVAVDGEVIGDYREGGRAIDLTVMSVRNEGRDIAQLQQVPVRTRGGQIVPLSSVARIVETDAPQAIRRIEEEPAVTLSLELPPGLTVSEATRKIEDEIIAPMRQSGQVPPGVSIRVAGSAAKLEEFMKAFIPGFLLAAAITYLLLAALFGSWLHPFVIIMSVPFALVGGFFGLWILHRTSGAQLDVLTMLGFVILIGTIVNNPILIVHQALNYMREGMDRRRAIALSTQTRVRPIFMSVITSVAGMAPLVVFADPGSELYRGLGAVVIGGLLVSTVFTLLLTPALMSLMLDIQSFLKWLFGMSGSNSSPPGPGESGELRVDALVRAETPGL